MSQNLAVSVGLGVGQVNCVVGIRKLELKIHLVKVTFAENLMIELGVRWLICELE